MNVTLPVKLSVVSVPVRFLKLLGNARRCKLRGQENQLLIFAIRFFRSHPGSAYHQPSLDGMLRISILNKMYLMTGVVSSVKLPPH